MPFSDTNSKSSEKWQKTFENVFKPIIEGCGYVCRRSELENGSFTKKIVRELKDSFIVLADITDFNSNVMWELGVRHALSKRTIMVALSEFISKIPSDIRNYGVIPYDNDMTEYNQFKKKIEELIKKNETDPNESDSPVFDSIKEDELILLDYDKKQIANKLIGLMTEIHQNLYLANGILSGKHPIGEEKGITSTRFNTDAISKLLTENYVYCEEKVVQSLLSCRSKMNADNNRLNLLTSITNDKFRENMRKVLKADLQSLIRVLNRLLIEIKEIHNAVKSNSLKQEEPSIIIYERKVVDYRTILENESDSKSN